MTTNEESAFELLALLFKLKDSDDRIIVINDNGNLEYIAKLKKLPLKLIQRSLNNDYSSQRNAVLESCKTDYLFMIDADEMPTAKLLTNIKTILINNNLPAGVWMARVNLFKDVKPIHALQWGWSLQGEVCNYPDMQHRLIKTRQGIKWVGKLHERPKIAKHHKVIQLPVNEELELIHRKHINDQIKQNQYYNANYSQEDNAGLNTVKQLE